MFADVMSVHNRNMKHARAIEFDYTNLLAMLNKSELRSLFTTAIAQTHFIFNGSFYDQIDGVAMGSPLAPVLANLFMGHHEKL